MYDLNMRPVLDTGWTPNVITNLGLERLSVGSIGAYMHIGSNSTPASFTDTSLGTWVARTSGGGRLNTINPTAPLYEFGQQRKGRYDPGVATGWVREMGLSLSNIDNPSDMHIRALLNPAVDKGVDNYLDVYHRMWSYPDLNRNTVQLVLAFDGETYDCTVGLCDVDNTYYAQSPYDGHLLTADSFGAQGADGLAEAIPPGITDSSNTWSNTSGAQNTWPYGLGYLANGGSAPAPWGDRYFYLPLDNANFTHGLAGLTAAYIPHTAASFFKFTRVSDRTKGIPKDETRRFRGECRCVVERYVP